jgi:hypothetical protein
MPIMNQTINRRQVGHGKEAMRASAESASAGATNQTHGVVNLRGKFGLRTRSTRMPTDTMTNASNVPIWIVWFRSVGAPKLRRRQLVDALHRHVA